MFAPFAALALGTLVSEDLTCITAGLLAGRGTLNLMPAVAACALGIYLGDLALWLAGRLLGAPVLAHRRIAAALPVPPGRIGTWLERHMRAAVVGSRFAPGARLPVYLAAGATRTSFSRFAGWSAVAVLAWTPILVLGSALVGEPIARALSAWLVVGRAVALVSALVGLVAWRIALRLASARGRQRLAARISRIWRWEFWPMWLFYAPVALYTFWLALRHGGYGSVSAANPGIPDGGIVGESKFDILSRLPAAWTIPSAVVDRDECDRQGRMREIVHQRGWTFPLILKPDVGQRGSGVRLARTAADADAYLAKVTDRVVLQPYHPGPFEAGVFYYRMPGSSRGRILTITDKHFPAVIGDGRSSLEDLIWAHARYRMQAETFLTRLGVRRREVPAAGLRVPLGIAGNHAQGTMFKDGRRLMTPALEARVDEIAREYEGFFIGRFDVRYADREAFMSGLDLAIVELNGATAECTNIYDPDGSLLSAYRQLFRQWRLVFTIGAANRRNGGSATSSSRLVALLREYSATSPAFPVSD